MHIHVKRTGGFGGIERNATIDTDGLTDSDEWQALADQAVAEARETPPVGVPDGFTYQISVGERTVYCSDPRLTDCQRKLISRVLKEGA